jgi:hypothetical protein
MKNLELCPKCFGSRKVMEPKLTKGFDYKECSLCHGTGEVLDEIADDFIFSITEENFEEDE